MLDNVDYTYNLLLGGDARPTELLIRMRRVYLNVLLSATGDLYLAGRHAARPQHLALRDQTYFTASSQ